MKKRVIRLLILIVFVTIFSACTRKSITQPSQEKLTASFDQEIETAQPFPTLTQLPTRTINTETPISSVPRTPYPTLSSADPKFLFPVGQDTLVIQNTFADGRKIIQLPPSGRFPYLYYAISPDGKWCAYFTGYDYDNPVGMTLNLFNLEDGSTQEIMQLVSKDYLDMIMKIAEIMLADNPEDLNCNNIDCWISPTESQFTWGILETIAWSPNSKFLAFTAQVDTNASQLYIFDLDNQTYQKMTDNFFNIVGLRWSPDNTWIIYTVGIPGQIYSVSHLFAVNLETNVKRSIKKLGGSDYFQGWLTPTRILTSKICPDGCYASELKYTDLNTGESKIIWKDYYWDLEINDDHQIIGFILGEPGTERNIALLYPSGKIIEIDLTCIYSLVPFNSENTLFVASNCDSEKFSISKDGEIQLINNEPRGYIDVSPDDNWFIISRGSKAKLYNKSYELFTEYEGVNFLMWAGNSAGIYFYKENELYFSSIIERNLELVFSCNDEDEYCPDYWSDIIEIP